MKTILFLSQLLLKFHSCLRKNVLFQAGYGSVQVEEKDKDLLCDTKIENIAKNENGLLIKMKSKVLS